MPGARITIDGLWHCLCPSVDAATLTRAVSRPYHRPRLSRQRRPLGAHRLLHTTTPRGDDDSDRGSHLASTSSSSSAREVPLRPESPPGDDKATDNNIGHEEPPLAAPPPPGLDAPRPPPPPRTTEPTTTATATATAPWPLARPKSLPQKNNNANNANKTKKAPPAAQLAEPQNVERILKKPWPFEVPAGVTAPDVVEALRFTRDQPKPKWRAVTARLVEHLLADQRVPPSTFLYETLLMAQSAREGSAETVRGLLQEMRTKKIPWSSTAYHSALRALAIHPDYLVRADVLRQMKDRWMDVTPAGHQYIALGLLRDEQYELALEKLEAMVGRGQVVDAWVLDVFVYVFGNLGFADEALRIARFRLDRGLKMAAHVWAFLLDVCARGQHHAAAAYVWERTVPRGLVNPPDGVCLHVLHTAAAHGDPDLATRVLQFLAARATKLGQAHYEAVADAYCAQGNVERAVETWCIMHAARVDTTPASVGALSQLLSRDPALVDVAIRAMTTLRDKHPIPVVIFNAILNQLVKADDNDVQVAAPPTSSSSSEEAAAPPTTTTTTKKEGDEDSNNNSNSNYAKALGLYRRVREFVPDGPTADTFRHLLWRCADPAVAQLLVGEMAWFGVRQNHAIRELVFQVHVEHRGPAHRAKSYFRKVAPHYRRDAATGQVVRSRKWRHFMGLCVKLIRRLIAERDPEAWQILSYCEANGLEEDAIKALREEVEGGGGGLGLEEEEDVGDPQDDATRRRLEKKQKHER